MSKRRTATPAAPASSATTTNKLPLPSGAARWSHIYLDTDGVPRESADPVPVDAHDRHTGHVLHTCPHTGRVDDGTANRAVVRCGMQQWVAAGEPAPFCPDHGKKLIADGETNRGPALPWSAMWQAAAPTARPFWFLAAQAAAGIAEQHWEVNPAWPALGVPLLAAAGYAAARRAGDRGDRPDSVKKRIARGGAYVGTVVGTWLTAAAAFDPSTTAGWVTWLSLPVAWGVAAAPWWRHLARKRQEAREAAEYQPEPIVEDTVQARPVEPEKTAEQRDAEAIAAQWAADSGIANTELLAATWKSTPFGWQAVISATKRGALIGASGEGKPSTIKKVAACFDVPMKAVTWLEEYEDNPNRALLLVQPTNPLADGRIWLGPDSITVSEDGGIVAEVGRRIDGTPMLETMYKAGWGAPFGTVVGTTGGGKSMRARRRLLTERWTSVPDATQPEGRRGLFLSIVHDPKGLEAFSEFLGAVVIGTNSDHAHIIIDALIREMNRRYRLISRVQRRDRLGRTRFGGVAWNPLVHGPIISMHWDEFHTHAGDKEFIAKLDMLTRKQRACAIRDDIYTHMGTLSDFASSGVREMHTSGRVGLLRSTNSFNAAALAGGRPAGDPRTLPADPGMCFVVDEQDKGVVQAREDWIPDDEAAEKLGVRSLYDWIYDEHNQPIGYPAQISPEMAEAFGPQFMALAAARTPDELDAIRYEPDEDIAAEVSTSVTVAMAPSNRQGPVAPKSDPSDALRKVLADGPLSRDSILSHSAWDGLGAAALMATASRGMEEGWLRVRDGQYELTGSVWPAGLGDSHRDVLAALKEGYSSPKDIAEHTGKSVSRIHQLLTEMMEKGLVTKPDNKHGTYAAV